MSAASLIRDFLVTPEARADTHARVAPVPPVMVVLGEPRSVPGLTAALALALARDGRHAHGTACVWRGPSAHRVPATRPARRTAARLAARDCEAGASGRLVRVRLPDEPAEALAVAQRVAAAADGPVALGLAGARTPELDTLFTLADGVLLALPDAEASPLARLAEAGLAQLGVPVASCDHSLGPAARLLALAGVGLAGPARAALAPALAVGP